MRENTIKSIWKQGGCALNGWLHIPSTWSAELMAHAGWDSVTVDMQHGLMGLDTAILMLQAISTTQTIPLVRVPWNEPGTIGRVLDAGAFGVICPMVDTRAQCEAFVGACRYHPQGYRSLGPTRAKVYAGDDYGKYANEAIITLAMIETQLAMDNLDAIASTPGLDGFYIGPGDLRLSLLGAGGIDNDDPPFMAAVDAILAAAKRHSIAVGMHTGSTAYARKMIEHGMQFVTIQSDTEMLRQAAAANVASIRAQPAPSKRADGY
ncbi:MAG: 2,4-dihydroxyhept-2-ene-1,7-dioic acid aldolase [Chloroflexi bacterium]|nr:2,4-dihydroxyhept-2-ene-1,7-dioic acid aldolase [Chloroflexota bacterium]